MQWGYATIGNWSRADVNDTAVPSCLRTLPGPAVPLDCPVTSVGVCTVINESGSYTPGLLQNIGLSELYCPRNILKKLLRHTSWFSELLKLSDHVWDPRLSIFSMLFQ